MSANREQELQHQLDHAVVRLAEFAQRIDGLSELNDKLNKDHEAYALKCNEQGSIIDAKDKELAEVRAELLAEQEIYADTNKALNHVTNELSEVRAELEAAEARIKASQEQEPVGYMTDSGMYKIDGSFWQAVGDVVFKWRKLYEQPPIPPELAELQRNMSNAINEQNELHEQYYQLQRDNAELRKQLEVREGWQPIETAPKDGSRIIVGYGRQSNFPCKVVFFNTLHKFWSFYGQPLLGMEENATHWMPLPAAPKGE